MNDLKYILSLKKKNIIYQKDRERIFKLYMKHFGRYPDGKITCGNCCINSINDLYKFLTLQQIIK